MTGRILCLDPGLRQIGAALSDEIRMTATEYGTLPNNRAFWKKLGEICDFENVSLVLVGRPLQVDGSVTDQTTWAESFAKRVKEVTNLPVELEAETGTSKEAERSPKNLDQSQVHATSARIILEGYLASAA